MRNLYQFASKFTLPESTSESRHRYRQDRAGRLEGHPDRNRARCILETPFETFCVEGLNR